MGAQLVAAKGNDAHLLRVAKWIEDRARVAPVSVGRENRL
jgi:Asp-tRNA(Asn)/Glu-tRNA(Gln) amidotransferase A subunit family amidase